MKYKLKNQKRKFNELYKLYILCKISVLSGKTGTVNNEYFKNLSYENVILIIDTISEHLNDDESRIYKNTFLKNITNNIWWKEYYSKSTYYRLQKITLDKVFFYIQSSPEEYCAKMNLKK